MLSTIAVTQGSIGANDDSERGSTAAANESGVGCTQHGVGVDAVLQKVGPCFNALASGELDRGGPAPEQEPQAWIDGGRNAEVEAVGLFPSTPGQRALQGTLIAQNSA